jgi:hypothetical protein
MAEREIPNRMTALGLLEQMRRSNANRQAPFDPISATLRERREAPRAPLFGGQRPQADQPLPLPPTPPAVVPPAPQARGQAQALPIPPRPPQLGADGNPVEIPPALLPQVPGAEPQPLHARFNPQNPYVATATQMAERYGLPANVLLSLLHRESGFNPTAVSSRGALGIGQLMPGTARDLGVDPNDPIQNIEGSARYLRQQLDRFEGNMPLALAAYNAGPRRVAEAGNAIPGNAETQAYVPAIMRNAGVPGYAHGGLAHLEHKYAAGDLVVVPGVAAPIPSFDYHVRANRIRTPRRPAPREELTANQLNDMVLDRITGRAAPAMEIGAPAEARERIGRVIGYDDGGLVQPYVSGGGSGTRVGNARIVGYGGTAGLDTQVGGGRLDTSITGQGMSSHAGGHQRRHHRVEGVNLGYTTPSGDRFTLGFHDRLMAAPDTLPGANPMEIERGMSPSRGVRVGFSREFADGGLAELEHKYEGGGSVMSTVRDVGGQIVDAMIPRTPLDLALYAAMGPGSRLVKLLGTTGLAMLEPSEARGRQRAPEPEYLVRRPRHENHNLEELDQRYAEGGPVMSDEEYDRRLLTRMKAQTGRTTESTNAEQAQALRNAGYDAAQLASDIFLPQSPLDAALMVALGPGGRMARLAGSAALAALEPSEAEAGGLRRLIRAYHGSPHEFAAERLIRRPGGETEFMVGATDRLPNVPEGAEVLRDYPLGRLRMDKIGTGTGAQAYTHGLYLGEAEDTARNIRDKLSQPSSGRIYEVNLDASPDRLMDWYLPRSQQPGPVQDALRSLGSRIPEETPIYGAMNRSRRNNLFAGDVIGADTATPAEVSDRLREAGIQGLTYLEPGSRTAEIAPRSRNYVIYDPEIIDITRRYAQGGLAQLEHKYADGGIVNGGATPYDPDAVNTLANQIEAGYV